MLEYTVKNLKETTSTLKEMDKIYADAMNRQLGKAAKEVATIAKGYVDPVGTRNWGVFRGGYNAGAVVAGIKVKRGGARKRGTITSNFIGLLNSSAAGAIFETAGRISTGKGQPGRQFIVAVTKRGGAPSRTIWRAVDSTRGGDIRKKMLDAVTEANQISQARLR